MLVMLQWLSTDIKNKHIKFQAFGRMHISPLPKNL